MKTVPTDNLKNPFQALFFPSGRILVKVIEFDITTKSGIGLDQLNPDNRMIDAQVISISQDIQEHAKNQGLRVGDYVVIVDTAGLVFKPSRHTMVNPKTPLCIYHGMDIYIKWKCYPQDYYDAVSKDFDAQNNDLDTFVK